MNNDTTETKSFLPWHISWRTVVLGLVTVGTFLAVSGPSMQYAVPMSVGGGVMEYSGNTSGAVPPSASGAPMMDKATYYPPPYPYPTDVPVTDTREFLKIYYNAAMRTRDVPALTRRVETTVRGFSGRIDQESVSPKYGSVGFSVPESKYEAFRSELEGLVGSRFLSVNISSQNFLPQKVSVEEQLKQANTALADYTAAKQKIVDEHPHTVQVLQAKIYIAQDEESRALAEMLLASENSSYAKQIASADANIKYAQDWVKGVQTQDQTLLANVATVNGTVSVQWIGFWDTALLYLPGYWIPTIFAILTLLSYTYDRRRML